MSENCDKCLSRFPKAWEDIFKSIDINIHICPGEKIHAVIGGFHLSGGPNEAVIKPTVQGIRQFQPEVILPGDES